MRTERMKGSSIIVGAVAIACACGTAWGLDDPLIYEPFGQTASVTLVGQAVSGVGLLGEWIRNGEVGWNVASNSLAYGSVETSGNHAEQAPSRRVGSWAGMDTIMLDNYGALLDGGELWFSFLYKYYASAMFFGIGDESISWGSGVPPNGGGLGIAFEPPTGGALYPWISTNGVRSLGAPFDISGFGVGTTFMIVGKVSWGADAVTPDILQLYLPDTNLNLGPVVATVSAVVDQSSFDVLSFANPENRQNEIDEIRIGLTYSDVNGVPEPPDNPGTMFFGK